MGQISVQFRNAFGIPKCINRGARSVRQVGAAILLAGISAACLPAAATAQGQWIDVSDSFRIDMANPIRSRRSQNATVAITIANTSTELIDGPLRIVLTGLTPQSVSLNAADGLTTSGDPYLLLDPLIGATGLAPGSGTGTINLTILGGRQIFSLSPSIEQQSTPENQVPVANAGSDQSVQVGSTVSLNGGNSTDADSDSLTFEWAFLARPEGSSAQLSDPFSIAPVFFADSAGQYIVSLVVDDGTAKSAEDTVIVSTINSRPVADAGQGQTVSVGQTVILDGSSSVDADGDMLTYSWVLTASPVDSNSMLVDSNAVNPSFTVDQPGVYTITLIVNDGLADSDPDSTQITTANTLPISNAGQDKSAVLGETVVLDGSGSSDPDGDLLAFLWSFTTTPQSSNTSLSNPAEVRPNFVVDVPGTYVIQLVVSDGEGQSSPDTVSITTENSPPVADAGPDQTALVGSVVTLDGRDSSDPNFESLSYTWAVVSLPAGSAASVSESSSPTPTITIDQPGNYVLRLIVNDGTVNSSPDTVTISTLNSKPNANAGEDQNSFVGNTVTLNGSGSADPDFDLLAYNWSLIAAPESSQAVLQQVLTPAAELVPDLVGIYVLQLVVNDGSLNSEPDTVIVEAAPFETTIVATPTRGGVPLDVAFSTQQSGGFPPFNYVWDTDGDGIVDDSRASFVQLYQNGGIYPVGVTVTDSRGNFAEADTTIEALVAPQLVASSTPSQGMAPLDVTFSAVASDADGSIVLYEWDFNGNGVVDQRSATTASGTFRYETAGRYSAVLTVTDNDGITASDTVVVSVGEAPVLMASVSPLVGEAPLDVSFSASAQDPDGMVVRYEWDFQGDGIADFVDPTTGNATHTYQAGGIYPATVSVFDDAGLIATRTFVVSVAGPPVALPRAFPLSGEAPLTVTFFSDGADIDGSPEYYDWDFEGDGERNLRLIASMNTTYTYTTPGTYQATLNVVDDDGLVGEAMVEITVLPAAESEPEFTASAAARPANGGAPLLTSLIGLANAGNSTITEYAWDFNGDGIYEFIDSVSSDTTFGSRIDAGSYAAPLLFDMDGDGDKDLVVGISNGRVVVYDNSGTATAPIWQSGELLRDVNEALVDVGSYAEPALYDIDGDGDTDILLGNSVGQIRLLENTGGNVAPTWVLRGELLDDTGQTIDVGSYANLLLMDHNGDGSRDLLVGNLAGEIVIYLRAGPGNAPVWMPAGLLSDDTGATIDVGSYAAPLLVPGADFTQNDLLVGNSNGQLIRFSNTGVAPNYIWQNQGALQSVAGNTIDVGSYANPIIFDLLPTLETQLFVGDSSGRLNVVTRHTSLSWEFTQSNYNEYDIGSYSSPALADLDGDSDQDLLIGSSAGLLYYRQNYGNASAPVWFAGNAVVDDSGTIIDIGAYSAPTLADFDGDGDFDLMVGNSNGVLLYFRNDGDTTSPIWVGLGEVTYQNASFIDVGRYAAPVAGDFDGDGDIDLLIGNSSGLTAFIRNDGNITAPSWVFDDNLSDVSGSVIDVGSYAYPAAYDTDNNGTLDLLIGNSNGVMQHLENRSTTSFELSAVEGAFTGIDVGSYAAPVFIDIDGDDDGDIVVGNSNGLLNLFKRYGQTTAEYSTPGTYAAVLRVTDDTGKTATDSVTITVLQEGSPSVIAKASVMEGDVPLPVGFSGQGVDPDGSIAEYAWDFDGDGVFDFISNSGAAMTHTYSNAGSYTAVLRVTDDNGLTATDAVAITANLVVEPSLVANSFNPVQGEMSQISTVIKGGETVLSIYIVDGQGNRVTTLVDSVLRGAGTYQDSWGGTNQLGQPVRDGAYYVIFEYDDNDGATTVVDLRNEAVFEELTPSRTFSSSFNPYEGEPVEVTYQIPWLAEVSLYFWTRDDNRSVSTIAPVRTLFLRQPRTPGSYTDVWDGFNDKGVIVEPQREYPVTLWLYRLPDNAIIVTGNQPEITTISATPYYFNPVYNPYASGPAPSVVVSIATTKPATLQAEILNKQGVLVRRITQSNRPAGANSLAWDGRDSEGTLVAPGTYSIGITAIDSVGNRSRQRYAATTVRY